MATEPAPPAGNVWRFDVVAGLTAAAVVIPKAMAYAAVAGLPVAVISLAGSPSGTTMASSVPARIARVVVELTLSTREVPSTA